MEHSDPKQRQHHVYLGVFAVSMAVLLMEITLTRLLSVAVWHHFAYAIISMALLGFGASGTVAAIWLARGLPQGLGRDRWLAVFAGGFSLTAICCYLVSTRIPLDPSLILAERVQYWYVLGYYVLLTIPFFFAGLVIALALTTMAEQVSKLYCWDLVGASIGALLAVTVIGMVGGPGNVLLAAGLGLASALAFAWPGGYRQRAVPAVLLVALLVGWQQKVLYVEPRACASKQLTQHLQEGGKLLLERWNAISRVEVSTDPQRHYVSIGNGSKFKSRLPAEENITIDGDAGTMVPHIQGLQDPRADFVRHLIRSAPYVLRPHRPRVLVIGVGGGLDVVAALQHGAGRVVGVDINPTTVWLVRNRYVSYTGGALGDPRFTLLLAEGRSYARRSRETFDIVHMHGVDSWSALASGAYVLSENYLYTVEAFEDYWRRLAPDGVLSIARFATSRTHETLRLVSIGIEVLRRAGISDPAPYVAVLTSPSAMGAFLMKKQPFTPQEVAALRTWAEEEGFYLRYLPGVNERSRYGDLLRRPDREAFYAAYPWDIRPVFDDSPFFFNYDKWWNLDLPHMEGRIVGMWSVGKSILLALLVQSAVLGAIFILLPLYWFRREGLRAPRRFRLVAYFTALGVGYMFIEIGLMQKFTLYLGHPSFSIAVVLGSMLAASGAGSLIAGRWSAHPVRALPLAVTLIGALTALYAFALPAVFAATLAYELPTRIAVVVLLITPLALLMGMPFPLGITIANRMATGFVPWAWGVNACASVMASILSIIIAMISGFQAVLLLAVAVYVVLTAPLVRYERRRSARVGEGKASGTEAATAAPAPGPATAPTARPAAPGSAPLRPPAPARRRRR